MKKFLQTFFLVFFVLLFTLYKTSSKVLAVSVPPFAPFSVAGNPDEDYYFSSIFPLLKYIAPASFEVYENREINRNYLHLEVCGSNNNAPSNGPGPFDWRDYFCDEGDGCDGGDVGWCETGTNNQVSSGHSGGSGCDLHYDDDGKFLFGTCKYAKRPKIDNPVQGTDFANPANLTYPKIQSESLARVNVGTDNVITWGSHYLMFDVTQQYFNQLLVLIRANQTQKTHNQTGEWPLGWVDWGYTTPNGKTLLNIYSELPSELVELGETIAKEQDTFLLNIFDEEMPSQSGVSADDVVELIKKALDSSSPPTWATDFIQSPIYPPSFRQGYARTSICVFDICCMTARCKIQPTGNHRSLYYDTSISQAYNAAINEFFLTHSLEEGRIVFRKLAKNNQLIRFASSAAPEAIPSKINERLGPEVKGTCAQYTSWGGWLGFATYIDYLDSGELLGKDAEGKDCFDTTIRNQLEKQSALATNTSNLGTLLNYLWTVVDDTVPVTYHLVTIPEAMGQAIQELQQPVYNSYDTQEELTTVEEYNLNISNIVTDNADNLFGGKTINPADAKRRLGLYPCNDSMYSAQMLTSIEAYALGARVGCDAPPPVPEGKCDGQLFGKLIEGTSFAESSQKGQDYFTNDIKTRLTPELMNTYAAAEKATGVPCEILAGIHFVEADNNPDGSLVSGRKIGTPEPDAGGKVFKTLLETATYAGEHLKGKVGGKIGDAATAITALSRYNGGGNSNCQSGYPYPIPYGGCPRAFEGEDDPYPTSFLDNKHDSMYLLYCADYTACVPAIFERPGSFTVALNVYNTMTKDGYKNADLPTTQKPTPSTPTSPSATGRPSSGFFPKSCGPQSLSTALGCIPYTKDAFVTALLAFLVGLAGAIALVVMLIATIQITISAGDPKKLQAAKELFTSAVIGLLFLIFSVTLLRLIAGSIIKIPGF